MELLTKSLLEFSKYFVVGGISFIVDSGTLTFFTDILKVNYLVSACFGFLVGLTANYYLGSKFVFKQPTTSKRKEFTQVALIALVGLLLTELGMYIGVDFFHIYYLLTKVIVAAIVLIWNYGARKVFVYRKN